MRGHRGPGRQAESGQPVGYGARAAAVLVADLPQRQGEYEGDCDVHAAQVQGRLLAVGLAAVPVVRRRAHGGQREQVSRYRPEASPASAAHSATSAATSDTRRE